MTTTSLAFDAAKRRTGWAYGAPGRWTTGLIDVLDTPALDTLIATVAKLGIRHATVENCYLGGNVVTLKALQEAQTRIVTACERQGLAVDLVYAQTWQSDLGLTGPSEDRKLGAMRIARLLGYTGKSQDEADAVCLCDYAQRAGLATHGATR